MYTPIAFFLPLFFFYYELNYYGLLKRFDYSLWFSVYIFRVSCVSSYVNFFRMWIRGRRQFDFFYFLFIFQNSLQSPEPPGISSFLFLMQNEQRSCVCYFSLTPLYKFFNSLSLSFCFFFTVVDLKTQDVLLGNFHFPFACKRVCLLTTLKKWLSSRSIL